MTRRLRVNFGYQGQRTAEIARGITVEDVAWFYGYARRLTEAALRGGLLACGATDEEATRFARALIERIRQLGEACRLQDGGSSAYDKGWMRAAGIANRRAGALWPG